MAAIKKSVVIKKSETTTPESAPQQQPTEATLDWQEVITEAETFAVEKIGQPLTAQGVKIYLYEIYDLNEQRPNEYVLIIPDVGLNSAEFADDKIIAKESRIEFIVQGKGKTFDNFVLEISLEIAKLLEAEWEKSGCVYRISNMDFGYDTEKDLSTRTVSCLYRY